MKRPSNLGLLLPFAHLILRKRAEQVGVLVQAEQLLYPRARDRRQNDLAFPFIQHDLDARPRRDTQLAANVRRDGDSPLASCVNLEQAVLR